ncbi:MAG: hypothetical protein KBS91_02870 [Firmicutes bacterium]|nr:hypothetical protein [Candidatus Caballimonas caccae]
MKCNNNCKVCKKLIFSRSINVYTLSGVQYLVIDIPAGVYTNLNKYCLVLVQNIPTTATLQLPVVISINGVLTTTYPLQTQCGTQVPAMALRTRTKYPIQVVTNTTSGVFRVLGNLCCFIEQDVLPSLPAPTANEQPTTVFKTITKTKTVSEAKSQVDKGE